MQTGAGPVDDHTGMSDMRRRVPWPFPDGEFPEDLGAVVQRTVLDGKLPALLVAHSAEGDWMVGDGVNDPSEPGATVATHMQHVVELDPSIGPLADLPPGRRADREDAGQPWVETDFRYEDEQGGRRTYRSIGTYGARGGDGRGPY